ncbi:MAG TPA: chemotaxis protein CheA [Anaeromyxobacter sp.]|nr:chemotaxis protein CheA [Anaeromyxobacter sp.]
MSERSQKAISEFVSEAQENIDALGRDLIRLDRSGGDPDPDLLNAVFRAAHTLKGLSSMFGVERMARLAHALEDMLDELRMGRRSFGPEALDLLLEAPEIFSRIIAEESEGRPAETAGAAARLAERLRSHHPPAPGGSSGDPLDALDLPPAVRTMLTEYEEHRLRASVQKSIALLRVKVAFPLETFDRELSELNARLKRHGEVVSTLPSAEAREPHTIAFELLFASREPLPTIQREAGPGSAVEPLKLVARGAAPPPLAPGPSPAQSPSARDLPPSATPPPAPGGLEVSPTTEAVSGDTPSLRSASQSVRVDIHKLDRLMNVVGELVLIRSSLTAQAEKQKSGGGDPVLAGELQHLSRSLERRLSELQAGILEVRMVPLEQVFDKLARMVRKLAREVGKEIDFVVAGGEVELDKLIVEELSDPLMHLIRNSIDHGIETPETRRRAGKPEVGRVRLAAAQRGNHVQIVVEDDGAGLDEDRIRQVAVQRGLATAEALADLSRREILNLVFTPGFSTATKVTTLSGRGVGLDVVKTNIAELSGIIDLSTTRGLGTRFEITLPVTLAILRALVVRVAGRIYAIPLNSVLEILEVRADEVRTLSTREVISVRGSTLPILRLARLFHGGMGPAPSRFFVVVVGLAQERLGIAVEDLVGQQDIVVKPLGQALSGVRGIAGATDLGNRRTVLVLDVGAIIEEVIAPEGIGGTG